MSVSFITHRPLVIAHRGDSAYYPDNTAQAFRSAFDKGADWVELDVRRTADGVLVVNHDAHLADRRLVREVSSTDLPQNVPTLAEALEACEGMGVNIEIKHLPGDPDHGDLELVCAAVAGLAMAYREPEHILLSSFDINAVDMIHAAEGRLPTGWIVAERQAMELTLDRAVAHDHDPICLWDGLVDETFVLGAQSRDLRVMVWTVDSPDRVTELASWGVDGIISNDPGLVRDVLDR